MKSKWKTAGKVTAALVLALVLLDVFCFWYYNPAEYDWDESRATDNIREANAFTSRAKEGIAWATIDENGYNNPSVPGEDGVFVLMMGSSHTEGLNVMQHETSASRLQERLKEAGIEGSVYNIGISAHTFARNAGNFDRALERFQPSGYVVMETKTVMIGKREIKNATNGTFERLAPTEDMGPEWISDRPLVRTLYRQWLSFASGAGETDEALEEESFVITEEMLGQYEDALTQLFIKLKESAEKQGVELIVYYHPPMRVQEDGTVIPETDEGCLKAFSTSCETAGITFLDMTERFVEMYEAENILPHGFINTAPGYGHLNPKGHEMIADALCEIILEREAAA